MTANPAALGAVKKWCRINGINITKISSHGEYIHARAAPAIWERLLQSKFVTMRHISKHNSVLRSREYMMPPILLQHVSHIFNVVELPARAAITPQVQMLDKDQARFGYPCHSVMKMPCWNYRYNQAYSLL